VCVCGPISSVGIATELWARRSGIESEWEQVFPPVQTGPGAHPASCKMGTVPFPGVKCGRSVLLTTHPLLVPRSWKSTVIPLPTFWDTPACNGITLLLYIYICVCVCVCGPVSSVGIATELWARRSGIEKKKIRVGTSFSVRPDLPWGPPSLLYNRYRVFPGVKVRPERAADHSPSSSAAVMEQ